MSSSLRSYYEYQLSQDYSIIPAFSEPDDRVYYLIRIEFILKKRTVHGEVGDDDERIDALRSEFCLPWDYIMETDNKYFNRYFRSRGVRDDDVREGLECRLKDLANQIKADPTNAGRTIFPIVASVKVYTVQHENETIHAAKVRAMAGISWPMSENVPFSESLKKVKVEVDDSRQEECCICLNEPGVGEEISVLRCLHVYHSNCIINWLEKSNSCPLCRAPMSTSN